MTQQLYDYDGNPTSRYGAIEKITFVVLLLMAAITVAFAYDRLRPTLPITQQTEAQATTQPTSNALQREVDRLKALLTAAEQQAVNQAVPTEDTSAPPLLPVQATAAAVSQPSTLDAVPAEALSPVDLTYRPLPTPTTMLSQEQYDAAQASEEQNFLNNQLQGLTPAQQMVQVHEAEQQAQP